MVQETSTYTLKTALTVIEKPDYAKRTPLVDFFCKRVTIIASG